MQKDSNRVSRQENSISNEKLKGRVKSLSATGEKTSEQDYYYREITQNGGDRSTEMKINLKVRLRGRRGSESSSEASPRATQNQRTGRPGGKSYSKT